VLEPDIVVSRAEGGETSEDQLERIGVLFTFVQKGLRQLQSSSGVDDALIQQALSLLVKVLQHVPLDHRIIRSSVEDAIANALDLVSVSGMMETTTAHIRGDDRGLQRGALQLIAGRLGAASIPARKGISRDILSVITFVKGLLGSSPRDNEDCLLMIEALNALAAISATALPNELATLSETVFGVANYLNHDWDTSTGLKAMTILW
jgi:hypothetical protein